jgi:soluble lytic murein transglycosylase
MTNIFMPSGQHCCDYAFRRKLPLFLCAGIFLLVLSLGFSSTTLADTRFDQRAKYKQALKYLSSGQRTRFLKLKNELADYSLEPYLAYKDITRRLSRRNHAEILAFRELYAATPLADPLMQSWLHSLGKRGKWEDYLKYFDPSVRTAILTCFELTAMHKTGRSEEAFARAEAVWMVDYSQPDECDATLKAWREAGNLTPELTWQRFTMSLQANHTSLASYLSRFLDAEDKELGSLMRQVHRRPKLMKRKSLFKGGDSKTREVIIHGIRRLARRHANLALDLWQDYIQDKDFSETERTDTYTYLAIKLGQQYDTENRIDAIPVNLGSNPALLETHTRLALHKGDWAEALDLINAMPKTLQQTPAWRYWKARVLSQSNNPANQSLASTIFSEMAQTRGFYGFMAADLLKKPYQFDNSSIKADNDDIARIESLAGIQRARELLILENKSWARREWRFSTTNLTRADLEIAAKVASNWGWYEQAIHTTIKAETWDDLSVRFPLAYHDYFIANARIADIPINWSLAIARQESSFMPDAKSSAGALGIMQVMPATARLIAHSALVTYRSKYDLIDPLTNIKLGSTYLGQMLRRFNNNRVLASAAYNAGPSRVKGWLNENQPLDVWIETIPLKETRNYVQNVLLFSVIYSHRSDHQQPLIYPNEWSDFEVTQFSQRMGSTPITAAQ